MIFCDLVVNPENTVDAKNGLYICAPDLYKAAKYFSGGVGLVLRL